MSSEDKIQELLQMVSTLVLENAALKASQNQGVPAGRNSNGWKSNQNQHPGWKGPKKNKPKPNTANLPTNGDKTNKPKATVQIPKDAAPKPKEKPADAESTEADAEKQPESTEPAADPAELFLAAKGRSKPTTLVVKRIATVARFPSPTEHGQNVCILCHVPFETKRLRWEHYSAVHGPQFSLAPLLQQPKNQLICRQVFYIRLHQKHLPTPTFHLSINNTCNVPVILRSVHIFDGNQSLVPVFGATCLRMVPKYQLDEEVNLPNLVLRTARTYSLLIVATPLIEDGPAFQIVEQFHFKCSGNSGNNSDEAKLDKLPESAIPREIWTLYDRKFENDGSLPPELAEFLVKIEAYKELNSLTLETYKKQQTLLNNIEEFHNVKEFEKYTIRQPVFRKTRHPGFFTLSTDQFKARPTLLKEDTPVVVKIESGLRMIELKGTVEEVKHFYLLLTIDESYKLQNLTANVYEINFVPDRTTFLLEYKALTILGPVSTQNLAFPKIFGRTKVAAIENFQWSRESIKTNQEQETAVRNIVNQTAFPAPYLLFGPPGTGKTSTIVEAIGQIYKLRPKAFVLVAATSNHAANELTARLIHAIPEKEIFRYFSQSSTRNAHEVDGGVLNVSNVVKSELPTHAQYDYRKLTYKGVYSCRVVVCTLTTAGRLVQAQIAAKHFSYIFVDECGSSKEISSLVPIAGLATVGDEVTASVVLAGDPHQLGPVIMFDYLKQTSHSTSMLERLIGHELYRKDPVTGEYNTRVITQLRDNFRSHEAILQYANETFYEGRLRAKAAPEVVNWALGWHALPNPDFPVLFHPLVGRTFQAKNTTSLYNIIEADQVMSYVQEILKKGVSGRQISQSDIGIISPYARQVSYLKERASQHNWSDIEIGSVEQYQGREKPIVIVSTVRTRCKNVGFLGNVKRMNVTLTRAQALMIIVGDMQTLENDLNWKRLIEYFKTNRAIVAKPPWIGSGKPREDSKQKKPSGPPSSVNNGCNDGNVAADDHVDVSVKEIAAKIRNECKVA